MFNVFMLLNLVKSFKHQVLTQCGTCSEYIIWTNT